MTTQILPTEKLYAGQYTKSEWLQLTPAERREISYKRYLQNVANAPKVNYDSFILSALYEIIYYISNGLFEAFSVVKGDVTANVIVEDENDFVIKIQTPTQYFHISDDKDLFFTKLNVKTFEKLVGAKTVKMLKSELPNETVSTTNEVFEIGKSSCKKLSVIQIKTYSNPKDCLSTFSNAFYPYWIAKYANDNTAYFAPVNAIDFKINLEYFNGFEFFAVESKKEKKSYITVYEKSTGFKVVESWFCFLDSELTKRSQCDVEFSGLLKSAINNLPFTIEPNESIESINQKRIAQNEIYVFGTTPEVELIAETQPETNEENEIESESEINQEPTNQNETMQPQPTQLQTLEINQVIQCDGYRLVVTATKKETSFDTVANFAKMNKNEELADYYTECATGDYNKQRIKVLGVLSVNDKVFNELSNNLLSSWTIANLEKFGGSESNDPRLNGVESFYKMTQQQQKIYKNTYYLLCLQVTNVETNETFYIDSQGYSYARYVGLPENIDYSQRAKVQPEYNERQPENELQKIETEPGVWHLSNQYTSINVDLNDNGVTGRDLTDLNNMPTFYNKTKKSFKKAFQALLEGFDENTKMYDAARLMAPYIRIRSYFAMD